MSHAVVSKYATHEHLELSRSWLKLLTFVQGMDPLKRETGIHIEEENENVHLFCDLSHSIAGIHSLLVNGAYSPASDEQLEIERTTKATLNNCDGVGERYAKVGKLSHEDSVCTAMISSSFFDSSMASKVYGVDAFHALIPSSAIWLIRECLKVLETCLGNDKGISKVLCKLVSPSGRSVSSGHASSSREPSTEVQADVRTDCRRVSRNSSDPTENASGVHILGLCDWPDIHYDVSFQAISVHLPLHRLLSLLIGNALRMCYGESTLHHGVNVSLEIPQADFFSYVLGDFHPCGFSALVMEHVLRVRVFCAQVIAGMWKKNGDTALVSCEWYRSVRRYVK